MVQIFIAHSSRDERLINAIASILRDISVEPFLANLEDPTPYPLPAKLNNAIKASDAMFVFFTENVANLTSTRDVVNWEISAAYAFNKPIYLFGEKNVNIPLLLGQITTYFTYDQFDQSSLDKMVERVQERAYALKERSDKIQAGVRAVGLFLGLAFLIDILGGNDEEN